VAGVLRASDPVERYLVANASIDASWERQLVRGRLAERRGLAVRTAVAERLRGASGDPLALMTFLDGQFGLVDDMLHYFDRTSMACSLEVRVPFLDHRVVEYCARIPSSLKVKRLTTKHLLKRAARGLVPDRIIDKPKIGFFNAAVGAWFKGQADGAIPDYLLAPSPAYGELLDRGAVERLVADQRVGRPGADNALLAVLMLEVWLSDFLPRALAPAPQDRERIVLAR
jgi:asparagine synthase (glutamine-hydrolysing)